MRRLFRVRNQRSALKARHAASPPSDRAAVSRFGEIFAQLPSLKLHDEILLRAGEQTITYEVTRTAIVPAGDTSILSQQDDDALLQLITCYPIGSTKERFVVIAKKARS